MVGLEGSAHPTVAEADPPDPCTLSLLQRGDTLGVNQLESPAMRHLLIQVRPKNLDDVIRVLALIRPGAASIGAKEAFVRRRRGLESVRYAHPCLEPVLRETHGLMLYDDDALRVLQTLTGWPAPEADRVRKQIAKVKTDADATALTATFLTACVRNGIPREAAVAIWPELAKFNRYSFCKSHATSYGLIAWEAAYFKTHYPQAFWTAALNNNQGMYPRWVYVEAIKRAGIEVRLPCANRSAGPFVLEGQAIRAGLDTIAHLDEAFRAAIIEERRLGPYRDLADFRRRLAPGPEALALLIRCGALDFTGQTRPALFLEADLEGLISATGELFAALVPDWQPSDYSERRRLLEEWQLLGWIAGPSLLSLFCCEHAAQASAARPLARAACSRKVTSPAGSCIGTLAAVCVSWACWQRAGPPRPPTAEPCSFLPWTMGKDWSISRFIPAIIHRLGRGQARPLGRSRSGMASSPFGRSGWSRFRFREKRHGRQRAVATRTLAWE